MVEVLPVVVHSAIVGEAKELSVMAIAGVVAASPTRRVLAALVAPLLAFDCAAMAVLLRVALGVVGVGVVDACRSVVAADVIAGGGKEVDGCTFVVVVVGGGDVTAAVVLLLTAAVVVASTVVGVIVDGI